MGTTPPQAAASPPPNGGNVGMRTTTRRRHADSQPLMLQTPTATGMEGTRGTAGPGPRGTRGRRGLAGLRADAPSEARGADGSRAGRPRRSPAPRPGPAPRKPAGPQATTSATQQHVVSYNPRLEALPGPSGLAAASNRAAHAAPFHCLARHWHHMWHKTRPVRAQHPSVSHISRAVAARASSVQRSK